MAKGYRGGGFGGMGSLGGGMNQANLMKQAQKMRPGYAENAGELEGRSYTATAGRAAL